MDRAEKISVAERRAQGSTLVMKSDRSILKNREKEPTGEAQTLWGKIQPSQMGSRAAKESAPSAPSARNSKETKDRNEFYNDANYDMLVALCLSIFGEAPSPVIHSTAEEILSIMKNEEAKEFDKQKEIEGLVGVPLDSDIFAKISAICSRITVSPVVPTDTDDVALTFEESDEDVREVTEDADEPFEDKLTAEQDLVLKAVNIDSNWTVRELSLYFSDDSEIAAMAKAIENLLFANLEERHLENALFNVLQFERIELVKKLVSNRHILATCLLLARAKTQEEKDQIEKELSRDPTKLEVLKQLKKEIHDVQLKSINLDDMAFPAGTPLMTNKKCILPEGSVKLTGKGYEEIQIPPFKSQVPRSTDLVSISTLPEFMRPAFGSSKSLNRIQSMVYPRAVADGNLLICAPTGAGKTNIAVLCILHELSKHMIDDGTLSTASFKVVYIAPMKALVQEIVGNLSRKLRHLNIAVAELTGDRNLTRVQMDSVHIIVTTPEKWDVVTRKTHDTSVARHVKLMIIDEIHLLHDDRGPALEAVIMRINKQVDDTGIPVRMVGLSATLPNFVDVSALLKVDDSTNLFFFDNSYRPVPLSQKFIGITEKRPIKRHLLMNEVAYEKVMQQAGINQMIVFVHSRKDTVKTAKFIRDLAVSNDTIGKFVADKAETRTILQGESQKTKYHELADLLPYSFAVHHAGMTRDDRNLVEELFAAGHVQILVSTATLAWGVNLPAHSVIIKGTEIYSPENGSWIELSPQDMLQMLGRAGRPQYDSEGEGIVITTQANLQYYISLLNQQLPIESQMMRRLADNLNAEIVSGSVKNVEDGGKWLGYSYLFIRMLKKPNIYSIDSVELDTDPTLWTKRLQMIHSAALILEKCGLVKYNSSTGSFHSTELGKIASYFYINHESMSSYNQHMRATMLDIDIFRIFTLSYEFKQISVRKEEKPELERLLERVPIPIKETVEDPRSKVNALLQAYISGLKLEGLSLSSDMIFVAQSAARLLRAMLEICISKKWGQAAVRLLNLCKMVERGQWLSMSHLRQFSDMQLDIARKLEKKDFPFDRMFDLTPAELGELLRAPKQGVLVHSLLQKFPRLQLQAHIVPITRNTLKCELTISAEFKWDSDVHSKFETFKLFVMDCDEDALLHEDTFRLRSHSTAPMTLSFILPIFDPLPPNYFVYISSDKWLHAEIKVPVSLRNIILPAKFLPPSSLLDLPLVPVARLEKEECRDIFKSEFQFFNAIQSQVFEKAYVTSQNLLLAAPAGCGKFTCGILALCALWSQNASGRCVVLSANSDKLALRFTKTTAVLKSVMPEKTVVMLTGINSVDLKLLETGDLIFTTPEHWDFLSRKWKQRKNIHNISLYVAEDVQSITTGEGAVYEAVLSRIRIMTSQFSHNVRLLVLSGSIANASDIGEWLGIPEDSIFNFGWSVRPVPLEIQIRRSTNSKDNPLFASDVKEICDMGLVESSKPSLIFANSPKQAKIVAVEMLHHMSNSSSESLFEADSLESQELTLLIKAGIGLLTEDTSLSDQDIVKNLFASRSIKFLITSKEFCWKLPMSATNVIIAGTQYFDAKQQRMADYSIHDILQMVGLAGSQSCDDSCRAAVFCPKNRSSFYQKFLCEPIPVESYFDQFLHDNFNAEIVNNSIGNKQEAVDYLTWSFFYRRMVSNPNYYGLSGATHRHVSDHLSELIENTLNDLVSAKCIEIENDYDITATNLGMIASYYYLHFSTVEMFNLSLTKNSKIRGILEVICAADEFFDLPLRDEEDWILEKLNERLPIHMANYEESRFKVSTLLQSHFSRIQLPGMLNNDLRNVLSRAIPVIHGVVDVLSSNGWLNPALAAMELCQMIVQAIWDRESPLKQIPHLSNETIASLKSHNVESVFDFMDMEDSLRSRLLNLTQKQTADVARFVNQYPNIDLSLTLAASTVTANEPLAITVSLERDDDYQSGSVIAPLFPYYKDENWWLVVGNTNDKLLHTIKKVLFNKSSVIVNLVFDAPSEPGDYVYKLYFMSDSYFGCDQEYEVKFSVTA